MILLLTLLSCRLFDVVVVVGSKNDYDGSYGYDYGDDMGDDDDDGGVVFWRA